QHELAEVLAGLRKPEAGKVTLDGAEITDAPPLARWQAGLGYIPSERNAVGSIGEFSLVENVAMNYYFDDKYARNGLVDYANIRKLTEEMIVDYDVATPNADVKAKNLSGGNLQKVILARVLTRGPRLVIANLPTQGLDVGATEFVQNKLIEAKKNKAAVLLISEDLDEILAISDWIAPMYEGEFMGILPADEANRERVGALMAGLKSEREAQ
ncbi:MAG: ATP-binding cassette domain-containing protein, partial [Anaerolineae bacterium]|nr:ATP-binding cassette domain-containing protein [Anaerolineae bacterium]